MNQGRQTPRPGRRDKARRSFRKPAGPQKGRPTPGAGKRPVKKKTAGPPAVKAGMTEKQTLALIDKHLKESGFEDKVNAVQMGVSQLKSDIDREGGLRYTIDYIARQLESYVNDEDAEAILTGIFEKSIGNTLSSKNLGKLINPEKLSASTKAVVAEKTQEYLDSDTFRESLSVKMQTLYTDYEPNLVKLALRTAEMIGKNAAELKAEDITREYLKELGRNVEAKMARVAEEITRVAEKTAKRTAYEKLDAFLKESGAKDVIEKNAAELLAGIERSISGKTMGMVKDIVEGEAYCTRVAGTIKDVVYREFLDAVLPVMGKHIGEAFDEYVSRIDHKKIAQEATEAYATEFYMSDDFKEMVSCFLGETREGLEQYLKKELYPVIVQDVLSRVGRRITGMETEPDG